MSIPEIVDTMESYVRKEEKRIKERLSQIHFLSKDAAQQTALALFGKEGDKAPELWDYFPELFQKEKEAAEQKRVEKEMAVYKARMLDFAYRHNHARMGGDKTWKA